MQESSPEISVRGLRFVADSTHFIACTDKGFRLHDTISGKLKRQCTSFQGGLQLCEPMGRTNIFFVVGTGGHVNEERNRLIVWDNAKEAKVGSILFKEPIIDIFSEGENWLIV